MCSSLQSGLQLRVEGAASVCVQVAFAAAFKHVVDSVGFVAVLPYSGYL